MLVERHVDEGVEADDGVEGTGWEAQLDGIFPDEGGVRDEPAGSPDLNLADVHAGYPVTGGCEAPGNRKAAGPISRTSPRSEDEPGGQPATARTPPLNRRRRGSGARGRRSLPGPDLLRCWCPCRACYAECGLLAGLVHDLGTIAVPHRLLEQAGDDTGAASRRTAPPSAHAELEVCGLDRRAPPTLDIKQDPAHQPATAEHPVQQFEVST